MPKRSVSALLLAFAALSYAGARVQAQSPVSYFYDALGRLVGVVDGTGESAVYVYDAVGNVLSIERHSSATVSIVQFTPSSGAIGASVTIYGTGFSSTPGQNTLTFNGTAATVSSSTTTQLVTTVPAGATSGTLAVTTPSGSATGTTPFVVGTPGQPAISSFTPQVGVAGTAVTISGTNFDTVPTNNRAKFNGKSSTPSSATSSSVVTAVPTQIGSGPITVATPAGLATGGDFFIPPSPYAAADVSHTSRATLGSATAISMTTASKIALVVFDRPAGQRVSLRVSNVTIPWSQVSILKPDNTALVLPTWVSTSGRFFDTQTLSALGSYTIVVDPDSTNTGNITLTAYDVPADASGTISAGGSAATITTTTPGQNARVTFTGSASQRVSLRLTNVSIPWHQVSITKPDNTTLVAPTWVSSSGKFIDTQTLPVAGTYAIVLNPEDADIGSATLTLYAVPADASGTISAGGSAATITTTTPGQNAGLTFTGSANQRVSLQLTNVSIPWHQLSITKPDSTTLVAPTWVSSAGKFFDTQTLPAAGTYTIFLNPEEANIGNATLTLYEVPADASGTITAGGSPVSLTVSVPGQNPYVTFSGTASQQVQLNVSGVTIPWSLVSVTKPDGSALISPTWVNTTGKLFTTQTLPATGTYKIIIDPELSNTGNVTLTLSNIP